MITDAPDALARGTQFAAGNTLSVEPTASSTSHSSLTRIARSITSGTSAWPKLIVSLFRIPPHTRHGGSSSPSTDPVERLAHRSPVLAVPAAREPHRAVHLDHLVRIVAGLLVQSVDVLRDDGEQPIRPFEFDDRTVSAVRFCGERGGVDPVLPGGPPHLRIVEVVLDVRGLLGRRVLRPQPVRTAEVRDPRVGRDPGAGEHDDASGSADDVAGRFDPDHRNVPRRVLTHRAHHGITTLSPRRRSRASRGQGGDRERRRPPCGDRRRRRRGRAT